MAKLLNKDPLIYKNERDGFLRDLHQFHQNRGTPFVHLPRISGKEIDLYLFYVLVTAHGGWEKVNMLGEWETLAEHFHLPRTCLNSAVALKQIYLRHLDIYEKIHFFGEDVEREDDDAEESRQRKRSVRALHAPPLSYNHQQHVVSDTVRAAAGLSSVIHPSDYERLVLSLLSPLPNEQDFAMNVCTLLSNEGKHTLKLERCPRLLDILLGHVGVYNYPTLRTLVKEIWKDVRNQDPSSFWLETVHPDFRDLVWEDCNINGLVRQAAGPDGQKVKSGDSDSSFLYLSRERGVRDLVGQRVLQVANIVRNLSFEEDNVPIMGKNSTLLRFLLLSAQSEWDPLRQVGLDTLGNICSHVILESPVVGMKLAAMIVTTVSRGLSSSDRGCLLACLEILTRLSLREENEEYLQQCLEQEVYEHVCRYLSLHDILLLVATLECLHALSTLGEKACNAILRTHGALDSIVSLITVEAQSYGPKACILMRVVETVGGGTQSPVSQPTLPPPSAPVTVDTHADHLKPSLLKGMVLSPVPTTSSLSSSSARSSQGDLDGWTVGWLQQNLEASVASYVEEGDLHRKYLAACVKASTRPLPLDQFASTVRSAFGEQVGPRKRAQAGGAFQMIYEGLQIRGMQSLPLPLIPVATTTSSTATTPPSMLTANVNANANTNTNASAPLSSPTPPPAPAAPSSPILKAHLSAPPRVKDKDAPEGQVTQRQKQLQQQQQATAHPEPVHPRINGETTRTSASSTIVPIVRARVDDDSNSVASTGTVQSSGVSSDLDGDNSLTSFEGLLQNGVPHSNLDIDCDTSVGQSSKGKGLLADLLERKVTPQPPNGVMNRELRISERGLELVENHVEGTTESETGVKRKASDTTEAPVAKQARIEPNLTNGNGAVTLPPPPPVTTTATLTPVAPNSVPVPMRQVLLTPGGQNPVMVAPRQIVVAPGQLVMPRGQVVISQAFLQARPQGTPVSGTAPMVLSQGQQSVLVSHAGQPLTLVTQPVTTGQGGQPAQTVLLTQGVAQGSKTIIILPATVGGSNQTTAQPGQKVMVAPQVMMQVARAAAAAAAANASNGIPTMCTTTTSTSTIAVSTTGNITNTTSSAVLAPSQIILQPPTTAPPKSSPSPPPLPPIPISVSSTLPFSAVVRASPHLQARTAAITSLPLAPPPPPASIKMAPPSPCSSSTSPSPSPSPVPTLSPSPSPGPVAATMPSSPPTPRRTTTTTADSGQLNFLCEWRGCMRRFVSAEAVYLHACHSHCPTSAAELPCLWERCDGMRRKRFSLMTHLFDRHCNPEVLRLMAVRRRQLSQGGRSEIPLPQPPSPHPGYAPNAAWQAIKRHALQFMQNKEMMDENEGPVTKSIRLTAALILRNLVIYSTNGKRQLRRYEAHLSTVALSSVEASRTVAQLLYDMNQQTDNS